MVKILQNFILRKNLITREVLNCISLTGIFLDLRENLIQEDWNEGHETNIIILK
jgi:hypothetical protein